MKKITISLALLAFAWSGAAQKPVHYLGLSGDFGYSNLLFNAPDAHSKGGVGGGIGAFYEFQYNAFRARTGFGFDILSSKTGLDVPQYDATLVEYPTVTYHYTFSDFAEKQRYGNVYFPLMAGAQFGRYYFMAGAKVGLGFAGKYKTTSDLKIWATDPDVIDPMENLGTHQLQTKSITDNGKLSFKTNVMLSAEVGVDLDEWLAVPPKPVRRGRSRKKTFKESLHYRAALFADYGLPNMHNYENNYTSDELLAFNTAEPADVRTTTMLGVKDFSSNKLNSLLVGVKFAILYELPSKQPPARKPVPKPTPRPAPRPARPRPPVPPTLRGLVFDGDSHELLSAQVDVLDKAGTKSYFSGDADATGVFRTNLKAGTYKIIANMSGYMPYEEEVVYGKDTVRIALHKIKVGRTIVLQNMFFATNETTILPTSATALEDLFYFLTENPTLTVKIVGHTDDIGSDAANQKLSEGRANSVRQAMIDRGIPADRLQAEGRGEREPLVPNDSAEHRAQNRRVELVVLANTAAEAGAK